MNCGINYLSMHHAFNKYKSIFFIVIVPILIIPVLFRFIRFPYSIIIEFIDTKSDSVGYFLLIM